MILFPGGISLWDSTDKFGVILSMIWRTKEACRGASDQQTRGILWTAALLQPFLDVTYALRRKIHVTGSFGVLDRGLDRLLENGIEEICRDITRGFEQRLYYLSANGLPHVLREKYGVLRNWRGFTQRLKNAHRVADRNTLSQQVLKNFLHSG